LTSVLPPGTVCPCVTCSTALDVPCSPSGGFSQFLGRSPLPAARLIGSGIVSSQMGHEEKSLQLAHGGK